MVLKIKRLRMAYKASERYSNKRSHSRPKPVYEIFETKPKSNNDVSPITIGLFILFCLFAGIVVINI